MNIKGRFKFSVICIVGWSKTWDGFAEEIGIAQMVWELIFKETKTTNFPIGKVFFLIWLLVVLVIILIAEKVCYKENRKNNTKENE